MKTIKAFICAAVLSGFGLPSVSIAQSLRCKSDYAAVGDSKASVMQKCGEPVLKDAFCKPASEAGFSKSVPGSVVINVAPCESVDEWTYNPGYGQLMTTLRFEGGKIVSIKYGDRVK
jgi:hypothetical protein